MPKIRVAECIGGIDLRDQMDQLRRGAHIVISTPGRLHDMLQKARLSLDLCRMLVLDEADRLLDLGFEDDIRSILHFFDRKCQIVMCSSVIPRKMHEFTRDYLRAPVLISVAT